VWQTQKKAGLSAGLSAFQLRLEIKPQSELDDAVSTRISSGRSKLPEVSILNIRRGSCRLRRQEVRVVEQVEEVGLEGQPCRLPHLEPLADVEVNIGVVRTVDCVTPNWSIAPVAAVNRQRANVRYPLGRVELALSGYVKAARIRGT
jgi:hypothetical protein